jgi:hypothetical protein
MRKPRRHTDARVADYWLTHDSVGEIDWSRPGVRLEFDPMLSGRRGRSRSGSPDGSSRNCECWPRTGTCLTSR